MGLVMLSPLRRAIWDFGFSVLILVRAGADTIAGNIGSGRVNMSRPVARGRPHSAQSVERTAGQVGQAHGE